MWFRSRNSFNAGSRDPTNFAITTLAGGGELLNYHTRPVPAPCDHCVPAGRISEGLFAAGPRKGYTSHFRAQGGRQDLRRMSLDTKASRASDGGWRETVKIIVHALILAMIVRIFFYQPFNIPSGSMKSTLLVGDYLFVSKLSYGYSRYSFPLGLDLFEGRVCRRAQARRCRRVQAAEGQFDGLHQARDRVARRHGSDASGRPLHQRYGCARRSGRLFRDREDDGRIVRIPQFEETLPNGVVYKVLDAEPDGPADNTRIFKVPDGHYFMMGDNRDNSTDSRFSGAASIMFRAKTWLVARRSSSSPQPSDEPDTFRC